MWGEVMCSLPTPHKASERPFWFVSDHLWKLSENTNTSGVPLYPNVWYLLRVQDTEDTWIPKSNLHRNLPYNCSQAIVSIFNQIVAF